MKKSLLVFSIALLPFFVIYSGCAARSSLRKGEIQDLHYFTLMPEKKSKSELFPIIWSFPGRGMNVQEYAKMWEPFAPQYRIGVVIVDWDSWNPPINIVSGQKKSRTESFENVVSELKKTLPLDEGEMYLCGLSAGAAFANYVAKFKPENWKGVVWISYTTSDLNAQIGKPEHFPPILIIHGQKAEQFTYTQAVEDIRRLRDAGISIEWFEDPAGGHEHRPEWTPRIFDWIQQDEGRAPK